MGNEIHNKNKNDIYFEAVGFCPYMYRTQKYGWMLGSRSSFLVLARNTWYSFASQPSTAFHTRVEYPANCQFAIRLFT